MGHGAVLRLAGGDGPRGRAPSVAGPGLPSSADSTPDPFEFCFEFCGVHYTLPSAKPLVRAQYDETVSYLSNNQHRRNYPTYLANGWSIGSGAMESACKTVVGQRLKLAGMRWREPGTNEMCICERCTGANRSSGSGSGLEMPSTERPLYQQTRRSHTNRRNLPKGMTFQEGSS